jgi:hypothetical protein
MHHKPFCIVVAPCSICLTNTKFVRPRYLRIVIKESFGASNSYQIQYCAIKTGWRDLDSDLIESDATTLIVEVPVCTVSEKSIRFYFHLCMICIIFHYFFVCFFCGCVLKSLLDAVQSLRTSF